MIPKDDPPGRKVSNMRLGRSRGQLLAAPERMKRLAQGGNDAQLWMCLVVKVKSHAVKTILHRKLECQVCESRHIGSGQTGDGQSEH